MGLQAAFMDLGGVGFLSKGGFTADLNWRFPFLIYLSAWAICDAIAFTLYRPKREANSQTRSEAVSLAKNSSSEVAPTMPKLVLAMIYGVALFCMLAFYLIPVQIRFYKFILSIRLDKLLNIFNKI